MIRTPDESRWRQESCLETGGCGHLAWLKRTHHFHTTIGMAREVSRLANAMDRFENSVRVRVWHSFWRRPVLTGGRRGINRFRPEKKGWKGSHCPPPVMSRIWSAPDCRGRRYCDDLDAGLENGTLPSRRSNQAIEADWKPETPQPMTHGTSWASTLAMSVFFPWLMPEASFENPGGADKPKAP